MLSIGDSCPQCGRDPIIKDIDVNEKGFESSTASVADPDGHEHKINFIKVGDYWEID